MNDEWKRNGGGNLSWAASCAKLVSLYDDTR